MKKNVDNLEDYDDIDETGVLTRQQIIEMIQTMKMGKSSKECSVCCLEFQKGLKIIIIFNSSKKKVS